MRNVFQGSTEMRLMLGKWVGDKIHLSFPSTRENYLSLKKKKKIFQYMLGSGWKGQIFSLNKSKSDCLLILYIIIDNILSNITSEYTNTVFAKYIYLAVMGLTWILDFHWGM